MITIGERIQEWCGANDRSYAYLGNIAGLGENTIGKATKKGAEISTSTLRKIVQATGISADWWLGLDNNLPGRSEDRILQRLLQEDDDGK